MKLEYGFQRETIDLSGFWHFRIDPEKKGESEKWYEERQVSEWDELYAPARA